ncbi:hypothetical protein F4775DRAFT_561883 [Biscogniauxia sp. FL1348]|nr:hypothetical protein F4775DRAFT_561883 [Biscogniauxia sp. FL1348]
MASDGDTNSLHFKDATVLHLQTKQENGQTLTESPTPGTPSCDPSMPTISRLLKGKSHEWEAIRSKTGPLNLLDLPVDILRLIVKEITHTNDLTALALTNSTLYNLAVPHIYARFDIVWPDASMPTSESKGVDALTYGLATLCLGSKFAHRTRWLRGSALGNLNPSLRLADNQYAKYTRKFSLGNGPPDWTSEYMITKESGKMLGTLVALAVAKMVNLETFVWDMPTGVLSDIFMALASLQDHYPEGESKFQKLWVRWHDNSETAMPSGPMQPLPPPPSAPVLAVSPMRTRTVNYSESHVEYPTFSIIPPLKSLTVLDIDELAYLDEMSILIERSLSSLRELRVGISQKAQTHEFAQNWDGTNLQQVDHEARWPGESQIGEKRLGGVLGVLVGRIYDIRRKSTSKINEKGPPNSTSPESDFALDEGALSGRMASLYTYNDAETPTHPSWARHHSPQASKVNQSNHEPGTGRTRLDGKLRLQTLELERVALSMQVCTKAIDWSILTNLTILDCLYHETLWKVLRRQFQPTPPPHGSRAGTPTQYHLALKHLHTDITSASLISFIKETLAPNTLEVLFLQDRRRSGPPPVTIDQIFKGAIRRHRSSLQKLLLDSSDKRARSSGSEARRWTSWVLSKDMVSYITSGKMENLKELAAAFDYKDWHPFLQRLPNIPQLRSLYITHTLEHMTGIFEPKELALQIVDIITLRPEIQLCYVGIGSKCFEILETRRNDNASSMPDTNGHHHSGPGAIVMGGGEDDEEGGSDGDEETEEEEEEEEEEDEDDANDEITNASPTDGEDDFTEVSDDTESEADSSRDVGESVPRLRLREILFYDDKVAIFKARHGKL